jgi:hypothetical protein
MPLTAANALRLRASGAIELQPWAADAPGPSIVRR